MWWKPHLHPQIEPWAEEIFTAPIVCVRRAIRQAEQDESFPAVALALLRLIEKGVGPTATLLDVLRFVCDARAPYQARSDVIHMLASETAMAFYTASGTDEAAIAVIDQQAGKNSESGDDWLTRELDAAFREIVGLKL